MATNQGQNTEEAPIPVSFCKLYLKLLVAQKQFEKAQTFLEGQASRSFEMWVEKRTWQLRIYLESGQEDQAINEIIQMIKYNYTIVEEDFQSIYNLHEVLLSLVLPRLTAIRNKTLDLNQLNSLLEVEGDGSAADARALFPAFTETDDFIRSLNMAFEHYANSFDGVKAVNALNCRKSALLSQMLLRHKVIAYAGLDLTKEETGSLFRDLIVKYCSVFLSVQTLVFDLAPYLSYLPECITDTDLSPTTNTPLITLFENGAEAVGEDLTRKARILLNKTKMARMLGHIKGTGPETQQLLTHYFEFAQLDGKPEKGERKIADDFVLVLDEVLAESSAQESREEGRLSAIDELRVGILEHALRLSPYNFDFQMALVQIYDSHGLSF